MATKIILVLFSLHLVLTNAVASPCQGVDLSGHWYSRASGSLFLIAQNGCTSITVDNTNANQSLTAQLGGTTNTVPAPFLNVLATRRGYRAANNVTYQARFSGNAVLIQFQANLLGGSQNIATGNASISLVRERLYGQIDNHYQWTEGGTVRTDLCTGGTVFTAPALRVNAQVTGVQGSEQALIQALQQRYGVTVAPTTVQNQSYADTLIQVGRKNTPDDQHLVAAGRCTSAQTIFRNRTILNTPPGMNNPSPGESNPNGAPAR